MGDFGEAVWGASCWPTLRLVEAQRDRSRTSWTHCAAGGSDGNFAGGGGGFFSAGGDGQTPASSFPGGGGGRAAGGGGGSFLALGALNTTLQSGVRSGNGLVTIEELVPPVTSVPEPASLAVLGVVLAGFAAIRRRAA